MPFSKTVSEDIVIHGKPYNTLNKVSDIILSPANAGSGYQFHIAGESVPYNLEHLRGVQERGARFNILSGEPDRNLENKPASCGVKVKVVEHLVSALTAIGLTDVHINFDAKQKRSFFVPIVGPGIKGIVDALQGKTKDTLLLPGDKITAGIDPDWFNASGVEADVSGKFAFVVDPFQRMIRYSTYEKGIERSITIEPHTAFGIRVESAQQHDIIGLDEQPFEVDDMSKIDEIDLCARPIARVSKVTTKLLLSVLNGVGVCKGISKETYFFANPGDNVARIVAKMFPKYKLGHNEHLAHSAIADFLGEKHALCASLGVQDIQAKITLSNTNHLFRVSALKQMFKDDIFTVVLK